MNAAPSLVSLCEVANRHVVSVWQQLCTPQNVNCRDLEGRHSTPLHFAAGYNRVAVVEYLLHHGADVHAKDKGSVYHFFWIRDKFYSRHTINSSLLMLLIQRSGSPA